MSEQHTSGLPCQQGSWPNEATSFACPVHRLVKSRFSLLGQWLAFPDRGVIFNRPGRTTIAGVEHVGAGIIEYQRLPQVRTFNEIPTQMPCPCHADGVTFAAFDAWVSHRP